jgi:hypothetical protein
LQGIAVNKVCVFWRAIDVAIDRSGLRDCDHAARVACGAGGNCIRFSWGLNRSIQHPNHHAGHGPRELLGISHLKHILKCRDVVDGQGAVRQGDLIS